MTQASPQWSVAGNYYETCSCDFLCPCVVTNLAGKSTKSDCYFAMVFQVRQGRFGTLSLDGLHFAAIGRSPGPTMADGNIEVGVIVDERASQEQRDALVQIASGQGGGPMAALGPFVGKFLGVESASFSVTSSGLTWSTSVGGFIDQSATGVTGSQEDQPLYLDNTIHPANPRLALAKSGGSKLHALGLNWEDMSGQNNGHMAPFNWKS